MRDSAVRAAHASSRVPIPLLVKCGWALTAIWAVTMYVTAAVVLIGAAIDAVVNGLPPTSPPTKDDILLGSGFILFAAVSGAFTWGVWKQRAWTREVAMAFWVLLLPILLAEVILEPAQFSRDVRGILTTVILAAIAVWYFYWKRNVVLYYDELKSRERGA